MIPNDYQAKRMFMKSKSLVITMLFILLAGNAHAQDGKFTGSWMGHLKESGMDIRLIFNISLSASGALQATLDSPDQSVEGLKMGKVLINDTIFLIEGPAFGAKYNGIPENDTLITGQWIQAGKEYKVDLMRMKAPVTYNRPQEPKPPYPYKSEDVKFSNYKEEFLLAGTLTIPQGEGPFPAVVLITGSGYEDRDETIYRHKPFLVIADYLTRNGIAVLRYDDRGTGESEGNKSFATTATLATDALSAVEYLKGRSEIDHSRTGLAGHSEGSLIAAIAASDNKDIAFLISLAGPGIKGSEIIIRQSTDIYKMSGADTSVINSDIYLKKHLFAMIASESDQKRLVSEAMHWYTEYLDTKGVDAERRKEEISSFARLIVAYNNPWFRYFLLTDPAEFWKKVSCPVLAINGEKDIQVYYSDNLKAIKDALKKGGNKDVTIKSMPGLNHLFQHCSTGMTTEYTSIEETFAPEALTLISKWIFDNTL